MIDHLSVMPIPSETIASDAMQFCVTCGYQNPGHVDFCLNCSAAFGTSCPGCGQAVPAGTHFCVQCGTPLASDQHSEELVQKLDEVHQNLRALMPDTLARKISTASGEIFGEQREVTVLYASVAATSADNFVTDEEDLYFLKDEALRLLVEVVYKYEGTVDKFANDGLVALFGAPVAHENDPERAVRAALEMQRVLQPWQTRVRLEDELDFELRFGLNTGLVVAGKIGNDLHMEYTVIGETVKLASQLEAMAEANTILVSSETYQRTSPRFEFTALSPVKVDWLPEPAQAFQPVGLLENPRWVRDSLGLQIPMIGRASELIQLKEALQQVIKRGHRRVALVTGEAGMGKTKLVAEFGRVLPRASVGVYQGSTPAYARSTPLWIMAAILRDILNLSETDPADLQQDTLQSYVATLGLSDTGVLPYLLQVLGLAQMNPQAENRLQQLDATMLQRQTHASLRRIFLAEARQAPTVLIFEDLHRVDPASRDFLEYLIHTVDDAPLFLVLVSRSAERKTVLASLVTAAENESDRFIDLRLNALSQSEGQQLADHIVKQRTDAAWALKQYIVSRAEGNPFYIEEMIRMLIDQGGLARSLEDGGWQVTEQAPTLLKEVPGTVKGLILARFDRLPEGLRQLLQKAAVLGTSFSVELFQNLSGTDLEATMSQLVQLEARQFLVNKTFRAEPGYAFRHTIVQEIVYGILINRDRRKIHLQVAQLIEQSNLWMPEEHAETLAFHYGESTNPAKAVPFLITAAENAARRCAYETAITHYQRAMELLLNKPDVQDEAFFRVGIGLGRSLKYSGEFVAASSVLSETLERVWHWNLAADPMRLEPILVESLRQLADIKGREGSYEEAISHLEAGLQVLGESTNASQLKAWNSLLDRMAWIRFRQGRLDEAYDLANKVINSLELEEMDNPVRLASLYNTLGGVSWQQGRGDDAVTYVERSLNLYESAGYLWGMASAYCNLGILYFDLGNWPKAANYYEQAYAMQQVIGNPEGQAATFDNLGILRTAMGEHEMARQELEEALAIRQRLGDAWGTAQSYANLARLSVIQGQLDEAMTYVQAALRISDTIGSTEIQIEAHWIRATIQAKQGEYHTGLESAQQGLEMAQAAGLSEKETDCLRVLGVLYTRTKNYAEAETILGRLVTHSLDRNDPYLHGLALLELGRLFSHLADDDQPNSNVWQTKATSSFNDAIREFTRLGAAFDLEQAQMTLDQI